uniref:V0D/AC39 family V-type ATPase subunit n=1 Tax=Ndongobacter massiliensis TaxID=1871025 RepID=UPI00093072D4|nr:V-type ATPase subunit [Ndongobacter massiliensis]
MGAKDAALEAKVRGLYGELRFSDARARLATAPKAAPWGPILEAEGISSGKKIRSLADFEMALRAHGQERLLSLRCFMERDARDFYDAYLMEEEIAALRIYLGLLLQTDRSDLLRFVEQSPYREVLQFSTDLDSAVGAYLQSLSARPYFRILSPYIQETDEALRGREFYLSVNLEKWYFQNLQKKLKNRKKEAELGLFLAEQVDWANVQWIYRARCYRDLDALSIQTLTMPGGRVFSEESLRRLSTLSPEAIAAEFRVSRYGGGLVGQDPMAFFDIARQRYFTARARRMLYGNGSALSKAIAYTVVSEAERVDLCRMAEAASLQVPIAERNRYLIGKRDLIGGDAAGRSGESAEREESRAVQRPERRTHGR